MNNSIQATQRINIIGKVFYGKIEEIEEYKGGKFMQKVRFGLTLNNGINIFTESILWNIKNPADFTRQKKKEYEDIINKLNEKEQVYVSCNIYPTKDGSMFDKMKTYEKKDGTLGMQISGSINLLSHEIHEDGEVIIEIKKRNSSEFKSFEECKSTFTFNMIVKEKEGQFLCLTDNEEYETNIYGQLPDNIPNKAKIGQGYQFSGEIKRDIAQTKMTTWDDEAKVEYGDNYIILTPTGKISNLVADFYDEESILNKKKQKHGLLEDLPF